MDHGFGDLWWIPSVRDTSADFAGLLVSVLDVQSVICDPLARYSGLRSDPETTESMVRQPNFVKISVWEL